MSETFAGTDRFRIERRLGSGAMGVVYEAFDHAWRCRLALKTIRRIDPRMLMHLKEEFRSLADMSHPNVIQFYELLGHGEECFFTMELIEGQSFLEYVRSRPAAIDEDTPTSSMADVPAVAAAGSPAQQPLAGKAACAADPERLRHSLRQLAAGVSALHESGKLHRDIKPSNIMVDFSGRTVLLDFGLVSVLDRAGASSSRGRISGTFQYMAPEQAVGGPLTPAADWYAVGATAFEALTGRPPFLGTMHQVLASKQTAAPPRPGELAGGVPADLDDLCVALLDPAPGRRPSGEEVLARLGRSRAHARRLGQGARLDVLIGREAEVGLLRNAFDDARHGRPVNVFVRGDSGCGKTALINQVLNRIADRGDAMVLRGRCFEQESVPYKGFDELLDGVVRVLETWEPHQLSRVLPEHIGELAQAFPVLRRIVPEAATGPAAADPVAAREIIRSALRELFRALAHTRPLVICLDDLHWGDLDTAGLLLELLRPQGAASMLIVCAFRGNQPSLCMDAILHAPVDPKVDRREIEVGPLSLEESRRLAAMLLPENPAAGRLAEWIAGESGGNPFFVQVLTLFSVDRGEHSDASGGPASIVTMEDAIWGWVQGLPESAVRVLDAIAVCSRPLRHTDALAAGCAEREPWLLASLRAARIVRSTGLGPEDDVEIYHDRIRETILVRLPEPRRRECHRLLAETLSRHPDPDAEQVAIHWEGAGDTASAARWYVAGADRAAAALAFDRASGLYRLALKYAPAVPAEQFRIERSLTEALSNAGRSAEAAQHYLALYEHAPESERGRFLERAAHHFCSSGYVDEGIAAYRTVLAGMGTSYPSSTNTLMAGILWSEARLRLRGLGFRETAAGSIAPAKASRVDALWSAGLGLGMVDIAAGAYFIRYGLLAALDLGDPSRIARALSWAALHEATRGPKLKKRGMAMLERCHDVAAKTGDPRDLMWYQLAAGASWMQLGDWRKAVYTLRNAESMLRDYGRDVERELTSTRLFLLMVLYAVGSYREVSRLSASMLDRELARGNLFGAACLTTWVIPNMCLAHDDPDGARRNADLGLSQWSRRGFHLQHLWAWQAKAYALLYEGEGLRAYSHLESEWQAASRSLLFRAHLPKTYALHARARACVMAAEASPERERFLREGLSLARQIENEQAPWSKGAAVLLRAGAAYLRDQQREAQALLRQAEQEFMQAGMEGFVASVRWQLSRLLSGPEAEQRRREAMDWMRLEEIGDPHRFARLHAPGFETAGGGAAHSAPAPTA